MLMHLRKPRRPEPPDLQHLKAARHDVISERMLSQAQREEEQSAALREIGDDYLQEGFDSVAAELARLPPGFDSATLDAIVVRRSWVLEKVNEKLSGNVLRNWDRFVDGLQDVTVIQGDIEDAYFTVKDLRAALAWQAAEAAAGLAVAGAWRRRSGLDAMAQLLQGLSAAAAARASIMEAQADGEYAEALSRCGAAAATLDAVQGLAVADGMAASIDELAADTAVQLASALQAVCTDFGGQHFMRVLEGYHALSSGEALGPEVGAAFVAAATAATLKVVRGVVLARQGLQVPVQQIAGLQEGVRLIPSDAYRSCLSRVLMVLWDVMAAHHRMRAWLSAQLRATAARAAALDQEVKDRQRGEEIADAGPGTPPPMDVRLSRADSSRAGGSRRQPFAETSEADDVATPAQPEVSSTAAASEASGEMDTLASLATGPHVGGAGDASPQAHSAAEAGSATEPAVSGAVQPPAAGTAAASAGSQADSSDADSASGAAAPVAAAEAQDSPVDVARDASDAAPVLLRFGAGDDDAAARLAAEESWAAMLEGLRGDLTAGRAALWEDVAQRVGVLLSAPAAFAGEHFVQVMEWTQTLLQAGEAFSGGPAADLRASLQRACGRFFPAHHSANISTLVSLLDAELWTPLPVPAEQVPSMPRAFAAASGPAADIPAGGQDFAHWAAVGNPWRSGQGGAAPQQRQQQRQPAQGSHRDGLPAYTAAAAEQHSAGGSGQPAVVTNASLKLLGWLADYAALAGVLAADVREVYLSICQLFELFLLAVFRSFSDVALADLVGDTAIGLTPQLQPSLPLPGEGAAADAVPRRLHAVLNRIANRSLAPYRAIILPPPPPPSAVGLAAAGQHLGSRAASGALAGLSSAGSGAPPAAGGPGAEAAAAAAAAARQQRRGAGGSILWHSGNMYGMQERKVAVDTLATVAAQFAAAAPHLRRLADGAGGVPDSHTPDAFFQTVAAAVAGGAFAVLEPPAAASPWVPRALQQARAFRAKLDAAGRLQDADRRQLWRHALAAIAEGVLAGFAAVTGRCTPMGRAGMSLDLQQLTNGLAELLPHGVSAADALRIADTYVKAFYIPWGPDLQRWAATHPEYTKQQLASLVSLVADSQGLRRRDKAAALAAIDAELVE